MMESRQWRNGRMVGCFIVVFKRFAAHCAKAFIDFERASAVLKSVKPTLEAFIFERDEIFRF